jgi:GTP-binding protein
MTGTVIDKLSRRKGLMKEIKPEHGGARIVFEIPTRGLLGYRSEFMVDTKGEGILYSHVLGFRPHVGKIEKHTVGSMVAMATGKAMSYSLENLQNRGELYIGPGTPIYEGMVVGNVSKGDDLAVNPIKGKQLTNMRSVGNDTIFLTKPKELTLEIGMSIMNNDEYLEITPKSIRLRKQHLTLQDRIRDFRKNK